MTKDLHAKPFDEGTKAKLAIFRDYLREWLPVFVAPDTPRWTTINIFDFFAGPGADIEGTKGTPLIILEELEAHTHSLKIKGLKVNLYFNEYEKDKCEELKVKLKSMPSNVYIIWPPDNLDFKTAFDKEFPKMQKNDCANLLFLDQNGIKHITEDVFRKIIGLKHTDFLFFISSSTFKRFSEHPSIVRHIKLSPEEIDKTDYHHIHRLVLGYYKSLIPQGKEYFLAPFSLKKNANIYGIIFGSSHVYGIEKFLRTCWKVDPERGAANFDIDDDKINPGQLGLFTGTEKRPKKVERFEGDLHDKILDKQLRTDRDVYLHTLSNGFLPKHAREVLRRLIKENKIEKSSLELSHKVCKPNATPKELRTI